jgi:hypothetical protein
MTVRDPRDAQHRRVDLDRLDHRDPADQRRDRQVGVGAADLQLRFAGARRPADRDVARGDLQRPRRELDLADRHRPAERSAQARRQLPQQQRGQRQPGDDHQQQQRRGGPPQSPQPDHRRSAPESARAGRPARAGSAQL